MGLIRLYCSVTDAKTMNHTLRIIAVLLFLGAFTQSSAQSLEILFDHPEQIAQLNLEEQLSDIDFDALSFYVHGDNFRLASQEERNQIMLIKQLYSTLLSIPSERLSAEMLEDYYFPLTLFLTEAFYKMYPLFQSLSMGREPLFQEMIKGFDSAGGWTRYQLYTEQIELISTMIRLSGAFLPQHVDDLDKEQLIVIANNLHYLEYHLFGSDIKMSSLDPWPVKTINKLFRKQYNKCFDSAYPGNTVYRSIMTMGINKDREFFLKNKENLFFLELYLPDSYSSVSEHAMQSMQDHPYDDNDHDMWIKAYQRRMDISEAEAQKMVSVLRLSYNIDNLAVSEPNRFKEMSDSLVRLGYEFAEQYPYANYEQYKEDPLYREYRAVFFEQISEDAQRLFQNAQANDYYRQNVNAFFTQKYGMQDLAFLNVMILETQTHFIERNPLAISMIRLLTSAVYSLNYADYPLVLLFSMALQNDLPSASVLFQKSIPQYLTTFGEHYNDSDELFEEYHSALSTLLPLLTEFNFLLQINPKDLQRILDFAKDGVYSLKNTQNQDYCLICLALAYYWASQFQVTEELLEHVNEPGDESVRPMYSYVRLLSLSATSNLEQAHEDAVYLISSFNSKLSIDDIAKIMNIAIACEDEELASQCLELIRTTENGFSGFSWLEPFTKEWEYNYIKAKTIRELLVGASLLSSTHEEIHDSFADMVYNYALGLKGLLVKSDNLTLQRLINSDNSLVSNVFSTESVISEMAGGVLNQVVEQQKNQLISVLARREPSELENQIASDIEVRNSLKEHESAVEFFYLDENGDNVYALIQRPGYEHTSIVRIDIQSFEEKYGSIINPDIYDDQVVMSRLFDCVWTPVLPYLNSGDTVYYSMDGNLNFINSEILPMSDGKTFGDTFCLRRVSTTGSLPRDVYVSDCNSVALFGGFSIDGEEDISISTGHEIDAIASLYDNTGCKVQVFKDKKANREALLKCGSDVSLLHIATHGYFDSDEVNAGAKMTRYGVMLNDGRVSAEVVSKTDFSSLRAVVLSSCESGAGDIGNDGVFGLQRGFKQAGAGSIIMALWPIETNTAETMMEYLYYFFLSEGLSLRDSFNQAQKKMKEECIYSDWAAFVYLD